MKTTGAIAFIVISTLLFVNCIKNDKQNVKGLKSTLLEDSSEHKDKENKKNSSHKEPEEEKETMKQKLKGGNGGESSGTSSVGMEVANKSWHHFCWDHSILMSPSQQTSVPMKGAAYVIDFFTFPFMYAANSVRYVFYSVAG
ncbi:hypothetical protein NEOKW01_0105 [Nematocida sp. AWRm80]|nr:hypothetical protein NEOKW01_0105 [Nematocida sp. AWRm80]